MPCTFASVLAELKKEDEEADKARLPPQIHTMLPTLKAKPLTSASTTVLPGFLCKVWFCGGRLEEVGLLDKAGLLEEAGLPEAGSSMQAYSSSQTSRGQS